MVKPLHRKHITPPTRCHAMMTHPPGHWRVCKPIMAEHWDAFNQAHPRSRTSYSDGLVAKRLAGGNPEQRGSVADRCLQGGQGTHRGAMSCPSSLCWRCAKVSVDHGVSQASTMLHAGVIARHLILTVPAMCRTTFAHNATVVLCALRRCGVQCLEDVWSAGRGTTLHGGDSAVLHTHGRHGHSHPHRLLSATRGGSEGPGERWEPRHALPYALLRRPWQWHRLSRWRQTRETDAVHQVVAGGLRQDPNGWVTHVPKGQGPSPSQSLARSVAPDVVSPPLAVRRLDRSDGERVTDHDRSHRTERVERETVAVDTLSGRMVHHPVPQGFKRLRSDGVPATKTCAKGKSLMHDALAKVEGVVQGAVQIMARLTSRPRYEQSTGRDPLMCPHCRGEMGVWRLWHPTYGVIDDEGEVIKRGTYASTAQRAGP